MLGVLLVAAAMTGVAIVIATGGDEPSANVQVATAAAVDLDPDDRRGDQPTTTASTETATTAPTTTQAPPPRPQIVDWPSQDGYTVVLASMPATGGRAVAIRKAREALAARLPEVGVLDSGEFSSLHPGYYVVFSGIYPDQRGGAERASGRVQSALSGRLRPPDQPLTILFRGNAGRRLCNTAPMCIDSVCQGSPQDI